MPQYRQPKSGIPSVDFVLTDVYKILNSLQSVSASIVSVEEIITHTPEGGVGVKIKNVGGDQLVKGVLVRAASIDPRSVIIAAENSIDVTGIIYDTIPIGDYGIMVFAGFADVLFNSNGATAQHYFRISKSSDTASTDHGKAQSSSVSTIDNYRSLGYVFQTITGAGLARCLKLK